MNLVINLTDRCNLRCDYCYYNASARRDDMTFAMLETTLKFFAGLCGKYADGSLIITFFGGEPLLRMEAIRQGVEWCERSDSGLKFGYGVNTNGTLLDDAALDYFEEKQFTVFVSIDGRREVHDRHRGKGSFDRIAGHLPRLTAMNAIAEKVITADTAGETYDSVEFFRETGFRAIMMQPDFGPDWTRKEFDVLESEYKKVAGLYKRLKRKGETFIVNFIEERIKAALAGWSFKKTTCNAGDRIYAVSPRGEIFPCTHFVSESDKRYVLGTVTEGFDTKSVLKFRLFHENDREECADCTIRDQCIGNSCACTAYTVMGDIDKLSPLVCEHERMVSRIADSVAQSLAAKPK